MLHARLSEAEGSSLEEREAYMFSDRFLLKRPLLDAITRERSPVLLIDEVDRADEAFEAFLLEVLAEWQVTIPELGTIRARHKPHVILTSNRTRELSDALRRRCLFLWLPYPSLAQEIEILHARVPGLSDRLAQQIAQLMQVLRGLPLQKAPGVAESLDWALALMSLHREHLDARTLEQTLGCVLKVHEDQRRHARASRGARSDPGRRAREPRFRRVQPRHRLRVRFRVGAATADVPLRQPAGKSRRILRGAAPRPWLSHRAWRAAATPLVRSTSWISPTSARFATRFGPFSAGRWTRSRSSTRRSRSSSFPAPPVVATIRCLPRGESPGRTPTAAQRTLRARAPCFVISR